MANPYNYENDNPYNHEDYPFNSPYPQHKEYIAVNLLDALSQVPDTGDWHGEVSQWCKRYISGNLRPNRRDT